MTLTNQGMEGMEGKGKGSKELRHLMPQTAAIVDRMRAVMGADLVNNQIAKAVRLQRAVEAIRQRDGEAAASAHLKANLDQATFCFTENGHTIGISGAAFEQSYRYEGGAIPDGKKKVHKSRR